MEARYTIAEAKNKLPAIVHAVEQGTPATLTRHGKSVAVLMSVRDYERLSGGREGFWSALQSFRSKLEEEQVQVSESDFADLRDSSEGRDIVLA